MSNLLRKRRDELLEQELEELKGIQKEEEEEKKIETPIEGNAEEETFRKRYGDLRRHSQKVEEELRGKISSLENALKEKQVTYPKTEEEVTAWAQKFPDLYKIIETMIIKREESATEKVKEKLSRVDKLEAELAKERALKELMKAHPDFMDIAQSEDFHKWLGTKSPAIQNIMYGENQSVTDAIDVVTMYKELTGKSKGSPKTNPKDEAKAAATAVPSPTRSAPSFEGEHIFSESEIEKMNEREYLKHEAEIRKQIANGVFKYDLSGAAR